MADPLSGTETSPETMRRDGVVIGILMGFDETGTAQVVYPGNPSDTARPARSIATLSGDDCGHEVALLFEDGDPARPLILGPLVTPARQAAATVIADGEVTRLTADKRIELRVGKSALILDADGRIVLRGRHVTQQASGRMRLRGGSIDLN